MRNVRLLSRNHASSALRRAGFTLIELMVVIAIIILAAGLMTPTITDFFKNRQLEGIRGQFGAAFNMARLQAVTEGRQMSVVFFREGVRVYDEKLKTFGRDYFNPESAPAADEKVWFELGFLQKKSSTTLKRYRAWERTQKDLADADAQVSTGDAGANRTKKPTYPTYNVRGLPKVTYLRDGSLVFASGSDVSSNEHKREIPEIDDIIIRQSGNATACFIDLCPTGQIRSRVVPTKSALTKPAVSGDGDDLDDSPGSSEGGDTQ
jgi:prepilin-type N-terminal cleavage/methylation domain-containing protein